MKNPRLATVKPRLSVEPPARRLKTETVAARRVTGRPLQAARLRLWVERGQCCAACGRFVEYPGGFELDHIVPLSLGGSDADENKQLLCVERFMSVKIGCHADKSLAELGGKVQVALYPEWLPAPTVPVHLVFGPPGSGKSTYAAEAASGASVLDLDDLAARMFRQHLYAATPEQRLQAVRARNHALANLTAETWVVLTGTKREHRDWWRRKLRVVDSVVMPTMFDECLRRIAADPRRPDHVKERNALEVEKWRTLYVTPPEL